MEINGKQMPLGDQDVLIERYTELNYCLNPGDLVNSIGERWGLRLNIAFPMWLKIPKEADHTEHS